MESSRNSKKRITIKAFHEDKAATDYTEQTTTNTAFERQSYSLIKDNSSTGRYSQKPTLKQKTAFKTWSFGTFGLEKRMMEILKFI